MQPSASRSFPPTRLSIGLASRFADVWLSRVLGEEESGSNPAVANAMAIVADLVGHAVGTAHTSVDLALSYSDAAVHIAVTADERAAPAQPRPGRDLRTVARLSSEWGIELETQGRTTVWCVLPV